MSGLTFKVADVAKVRDAAKAKGCKVSGDRFRLGGVTFQSGGVSSRSSSPSVRASDSDGVNVTLVSAVLTRRIALIHSRQ